MSGVIEAVLWNTISRIIGFMFRILIIVSWFATMALFLLGSIVFIILFLLWPVIIVAGLISGVVLLAG